MLAVLGSTLIVCAGILFLQKKNWIGAGVLCVSLIPFLFVMTTTKAVFSWLGLINLLLLLVVVINGMYQREGER